jgi:N-acetylneuraminate synthase/N,N'-diacetyllegionaminate synthase
MKVDSSIFLGKSKIGEGESVYIIAEVGVNHNGDLALAKKLIHEAALCGVDCVKFQTFKAERVVTKNAPKATYQLKTTAADESQEKMLKKLEMSMDAYREIIECCNDNNVLFISTPYNVEDVDFLEQLGVSAYKLASIHAAEPWFASYVAKTGKPVILSTGMATLDEVEMTVKAMRATGNGKIILLQCTTNYPSRIEDTNLLSMQTLANKFNLTVGYSDHTVDDIACIVSIGLGAKVIEKHFTLDKTMEGPDHSTSATPDEFRRLVKAIRSAEIVMGSAIKQPCAAERENMEGMRRSIVAKCNIKQGEVINESLITFKRPATGLESHHFSEMLGKRVARDIKIDEFVLMKDVINND